MVKRAENELKVANDNIKISAQINKELGDAIKKLREPKKKKWYIFRHKDKYFVN